MAAQAEIIVALDKHLFINRTVRLMADDTAFAHGRVLEDKRTGLLLMALRASPVFAGERDFARGFHYIHAVWVVALDAVHPALDDRVMLREVELGLGFKMALEAGSGIAARIDYKLIVTAPGGDMQAAGAMTGLATLLARESSLVEMQARVGTLGECAGNVRVTIGANAVADVSGAFDRGRSHDGAGNSGTGVDEENGWHGGQHQCHSAKHAEEFHRPPPDAKIIANPVIAGL
jgi:hypothetical protein